MHRLEKNSAVEQILDSAESEKRCGFSAENEMSHKLCRRVCSGYLISPLKGLYLRSNYWEALPKRDKKLHIIRALHAKHSDWVFSYSTAALIHGLDVSYVLMNPVHLMTSVSRHTPNSAQIHRHFMHDNLADELTRVDGIPTTSLIRTIFDCARFYSFENSLGIIDSALRRTSLTVDDLLAFCDAKRKFRGCKRARIAISYGDGLSENGGESLARARMISMGFAVPQLQKEFIDRIDHRRYRADYAWPIEDGITLLGEYHGKQKYLDPDMTKGQSIEQLISAETKRRNNLSASHTEMLDFDYADVMKWRYFYHLLAAFGVPRREGATVGNPEFNRKLL